MKRLSTRLLTLSLLSGIAAPIAAQDASEMLERVIPAVVTVGVMSADDGGTTAFGFAAESDELPSSVAYQAPLYLRGMSGSGSGFVIERNGRRYIVTNAHVIANADPGRIYVYSHERNRYPTQLVGADTHWDVAVLEVDRGMTGELRTIGIRTAQLRVGTPVYAIGNPQGIRPYTITQGIVSGLNRAGAMARTGYVQHDAGMVFGNSGGPLVGTDGRVVGLNTAIGTHNNTPLTYIGLALSGDRLERVVNDIIATGRVRRPFLGVYLESQRLPDGSSGIMLADTLPGSPAAAAGVPAGASWQIVAINGERMYELAEISAALELIAPTAPVQLTLSRRGESRTVTIRPRTLDDDLLTDIGAWVLAKRLGITATGNLSLILAPNEPPRRWSVWETSRDGLRAVDAVPSRAPRQGDTIVQAGIVTDGSFRLYRASTLKDIAIISRMVMPNGWLTLVLHDGSANRAVTTLVYTSTVL